VSLLLLFISIREYLTLGLANPYPKASVLGHIWDDPMLVFQYQFLQFSQFVLRHKLPFGLYQLLCLCHFLPLWLFLLQLSELQ